MAKKRRRTADDGSRIDANTQPADDVEIEFNDDDLDWPEEEIEKATAPKIPAKAKPKTKPATKAPTSKKDGKQKRVDMGQLPVAVPPAKRLSKKKQDEYNAKWNDPESRRSLVDLAFASAAEFEAGRVGQAAIFTGTSKNQMNLYIPVPYLAWEILTNVRGFPLGALVQLVAPPGVGKSGLLAEIGRWFGVLGGGLELVDNESKHYPEWFRSIMGSYYDESCRVQRTKSTEEMQIAVSNAVKFWQNFMEGTADSPGPGYVIPIVIGIDSIVGSTSEETANAIFGGRSAKGKSKKGEGFASRGHPVEALINSRYFKSLKSKIRDLPVSIIGVNHLRVSRDENGIPQELVGGGALLDFAQTLQVNMEKIGGRRSRHVTQNYESFTLRLQLSKNSQGRPGLPMHVRVLNWDEITDAGECVLRTVWDWDWCLVHIINYVLNDTNNKDTRLKAQLAKFDIHLKATSQSTHGDNKAWSKMLGMTEKDAVPWTELGEMLTADPDIVNRIRNGFGVKTVTYLQEDMRDQIAVLREKLDG